MNNNSAPSQFNAEVPVRRLAPVISLKPVSNETENKPKRRKISKEPIKTKSKGDAEPPRFYDRPIYKPRKYDLL